MYFTFTALGKPATQGSKRHVGRGIMIESNKRLPGWRSDITSAAIRAIPDGWPRQGPMSLAVVFTFARPANHHIASNRTRPLKPDAPFWHTAVTGDLDKLARAVCDAITASGAWLDDSQVVELHCVRRYAEPGQPEGAAITIESLA